MKNLFNKLILSAFLFTNLNAEIINTNEIKDINSELTENTLVLFNIAEVLLDTETSLGTQAWRKFVRSRVDSKTHDELTLFVFEKVPPKAVEPAIPDLIHELQSSGQVTFAFTSRGRHEWYGTQIPDIDLITEKVLNQVGIDFSKTQLNGALALLPLEFSDLFHEGVIYSTNFKDKGKLLTSLFEKTGYRPSKIIFVDDKADSLVSVEKAMAEIGIPFTGFAYSRTAKEHAGFDPMIANIQLDRLITSDEVLSDEEALKIKDEKYSDTDPAEFLQEIVRKWQARHN